jgi:hypothetical protein
LDTHLHILFESENYTLVSGVILKDNNKLIDVDDHSSNQGDCISEVIVKDSGISQSSMATPSRLNEDVFKKSFLLLLVRDSKII